MKVIPYVLATLMFSTMLLGIVLLHNSGIKISVDQCDESKIQVVCQKVTESNQ